MPRTGRFHVILVRPRNPLNIGAAARAMSNFGFSSLRLVNPYVVAFREARSAVGASEILANATEHKSVADATEDCALIVGTTALRTRTLPHRLHAPPVAAPLIRKRLASQDVALLFGSEKTGLSADDLSHCHWSVRIPTAENISMNLGQAVAVCLYELAREAKSKVAPPRDENASAGQIERLYRLLDGLLETSGYLKPASRETDQQKLRSLLRRLRLSPEDVDLLQGMLRQLHWKIGAAHLKEK
jgi:TrmH family RNA methyltransferase